MLHIPCMKTGPSAYPPANPAIEYDFPLDIWQQHAIVAIHKEENVFVVAKTGSGKTLVAEYQIAYALKHKRRVFYTTPIKSLTNQKYHDLKHLFPSASVGIMTGDIKSNPEADIVVMTTEILRNLLFKQSTVTAKLGTTGQLSLDDVDAVIFDEVHYINDPDRGHVWEETLILLDPRMKLILLSATIDSACEFGEWLGNIKQKRVHLLQTTHRIVPLIHGLYDPSASPLPLVPLKKSDEGKYISENYHAWLKGRDTLAKEADEWKHRVQVAKLSGDSIAGAKGKVKPVSFTHTLNTAVVKLKQCDLLPALFFVMSRKECERYAEQVSEIFLDSSEIASVQHIINFHLHHYAETLQHLPQYHQIIRLLQRGIAFHHSGLLPLLKEIVELLFSKGYVKVLFCTETFAVGLNMPTRTVVFLDLKKPAEKDGFRPLRSDEYIQMAGRAGRRGKDAQGIVLYLPSRNPVSPDEMHSILSGRLQPLTSRLQFHYDFILKAIHTTTDAPVWESIIHRSYWITQQNRQIAQLQKEIIALQTKQSCLQLTDAQKAEYDYKTNLQAEIKTLTNANRRKKQQELEQWSNRHLGPVWKQAEQAYQAWKLMEHEIQTLQKDIQHYEEAMKVFEVENILKVLDAWGCFVPAPADSAPAPASIPRLSKLGIYATECNEGNGLLMAQLYDSQILADASPEEIVAVLGAFIVDKEAIDKTVHPLDLDTTPKVKHVLMELEKWSRRGTELEDIYKIQSSTNDYWTLTTLWVGIGYDWYNEKEACDIVSKYEIYEGNLMRGLHKLAALVNEWITCATYNVDVAMLEKCRDVPNKILRSIAQPESLYLRL